MDPNNSLQPPQPIAQPPVDQPTFSAPSNEPKKKRIGKLIILVVGILFLISAGVIAFQYFRYKDFIDTVTQDYNTAEFDEFYRRDAEKYKEAAKKITFDLYDTSYETEEVGVTARTAGTASERGPAAFGITYSTLRNGGYQPFQEAWDRQRIVIDIFNPSDIPGHTSNCGPAAPRYPEYDFITRDDNNRECVMTAHTFQGQPVYESESDTFSGAGSDGQAVAFRVYTVTVGGSRVIVNASKNDESLVFTILDSMKKTNPDQMDFVLKDESSPD